MKIKNAIIITDANSELRMTLAEQADFTGNVIFARDKLPTDLTAAIDYAMGRSSKTDSPTTNRGGVLMKPELVG
jgi:hypothetical protein